MEFDAVIEGTEGPDVIVAADWDDGHFGGHGGNRRHLIFGYGGNDLILGLGGADCVDGGGGNDKLFGNNGADVLLGRAGDDRVYGGHNDDYIDGGPDDDFCVGGQGDDTIVNCERFGPHPPWGFAHHSVPTVELFWPAEPDALRYNVYRAEDPAGPYEAIGSSTEPAYSDTGVQEGATYYYAVTAVFTGGLESEKSEPSAIDGPAPEAASTDAAAAETATATPTSTATLTPRPTATPTSTPTATSTAPPTETQAKAALPPLPDECAAMAFDHTILGSEAADEIRAGEGRHLVFGLGGDDVVYGSDSDDCIVGGDGDDEIHAVGGLDVLLGGAGNDRLFGSDSDDYLDGGAGRSDFCVGGLGDDRVLGCERDAPANLEGYFDAAGPAVELAWDPEPGAVSYNLYRATSPGGPYEPIGSSPTASFSDADVADGVTYYYVVTAVFGEDLESNESNEAVAEVPAPTSTPESASPTETPTQTPATPTATPTQTPATPTPEATSTSTPTPTPSPTSTASP